MPRACPPRADATRIAAKRGRRVATWRGRRIAAGRERRSAARHARGFTLIELLVVLTILGLAGVAIVLTLPDDSGRLRHESERLAGYLGHARDEAIMSLRTVEVVADARGYEVRREDHGRWQVLGERPFQRRRWDDGVQPLLPRGQQRVSVRFDPTGMSEPRTLALAFGQQRMQLRVGAGGEVAIDARPR